MAIGLLGTLSGERGGSGTSVTISTTLHSGSDRALLLWVCWANGNANPVVQFTPTAASAIALTKKVEYADGARRSGWWYLPESLYPGTLTGSLFVDGQGSTDRLVVLGQEISGADQTFATSVATAAVAFAGVTVDAPLSGSAAPTVGSRMFGGAFIAGTDRNPTTPNAGQTFAHLSATLSGITSFLSYKDLASASDPESNQVSHDGSQTPLFRLTTWEIKAATAGGATSYDLTGLSVSVDSTVSSGALSLDYSLSGASLSQDQTVEAGALSLDYGLSGLGITQDQTVDQGSLALDYGLTGLGASQGQTVEAGSLSLVYSLSGLGLVMDQTVSVGTLTTGIVYDLTGLSVSMDSTVDAGSLSLDYGLTGLGVTMGLVPSSPLMSLVYALSGLGVVMDMTASVGVPSLPISYPLRLTTTHTPGSGIATTHSDGLVRIDTSWSA